MRFVWQVAAFVGLAVLGLGCTSTESGKEAGGGKAGGEQGLKVGIVFDSGGRGDKSFNDSAWVGIERAVEEFGIEASDVSSQAEKDYETNLTALAERGMDLVIAVGMNQGTALEKVAPQFPDTKFAIVDYVVDQPNVRSLLFTEHEGSFLAGYLAALVSKSDKIGFVGGMQIPLIEKFYYGYVAGAKMANPGIEVLPPRYTGDWNSADVAKSAANVLYAAGADIVYHAAGRAGLGVIGAAKEQGKFAIGVDSNQDYIEQGFVLTSMVKRVDEAVFQTIKDVVDGNFAAGQTTYSLKDNGVGLTEFEFTKDKIGEEALAKLETVRKLIVDGEVKPPSTKAEFEAFAANLPTGP